MRLANAQAGATLAKPADSDASTTGEPRGGSAQVPTADDVCHAVEQSAAKNSLTQRVFQTNPNLSNLDFRSAAIFLLFARCTLTQLPSSNPFSLNVFGTRQ
jgi:hypothetical protein